MAIITLVFIIVFCVGIVGALLVDGTLAFLVYQFVYFLNPLDRWWGSTIPDVSYSFISVIVLATAYLLRYRKTKDQTSLKNLPPAKWMVFFLLIYFFVWFFALDPDAHLEQTIWLLKLFVVVYIAYKVLVDTERLKWATWAYLAGATYIGYVAYGTGRNRGARLEGIGTVDAPDSNGIAAAIAPAVILLIYYAWVGNRYVKPIAIVSAAFVVNAIILINSRGAFLAVVVGSGMFIAYMLFSIHQRNFQRGFAIIIVIAGTLGSYSLTDAAFWERMATLQEVDDGAASGSHRIEFWFATFDMVADYPAGLGIRGYNKVSRFYLNPALYGDKNKSVHSSWFQVLAEVGWVGLFIFLAMLVSCFRLSWQTKKYLVDNKKIDDYFLIVALEASLVTFLVAATFVNRGRAEILYWLILFLLSACNSLYLQKLRVGLPIPAQQPERMKIAVSSSS